MTVMDVKTLLKTAKLGDDVVKWLTDTTDDGGVGMECVNDWLGYFTVNKYEDEVKALLDTKQTLYRLQLSDDILIFRGKMVTN